MRRGAVLLALTVLGALPATAQTDPCARFKWPVARERDAFSGAQLAILKSGAQYPGPLAGVTVALAPQDKGSFPVPPAHKPRSEAPHGAVLDVPPLAAGGTYQVTLSDEAWVDLVQNGRILRSTAFSGATGCPGVRKSVRFKVENGPVTVEISDAGAERINMDFLPAEGE